jgi:transcriptional regulator with XRE-family HTH domain
MNAVGNAPGPSGSSGSAAGSPAPDAKSERRRELGEFIRSRRNQLVRADLGLPPIGRSRLLGLRREEISAFAGVSVTWLTWLEQGRDINPSRQVLDAIARNLHLTPAEHDYLLALGGYAVEPVQDVRAVEAAPPHLQRLLDGLEFPAFAVAPDWGIAGWNRAYSELYSSIDNVDVVDRNLLWLVFTDPHLRDLLPDWEAQSRHFLAEFRAEAGARLSSPAHTALIARLLASSPEFAAQWQEKNVARFASRRRVFRSANGAERVFEHHRLVPSDFPELHLVFYAPVGG